MNYLVTFAFLQLLDLLTTIAGLRLGAGEANPIAVWAMRMSSPWLALILVKALAFVWAGVCLLRKKPLVIKIVNCMFAALIAWNLFILSKFLGAAA